MAPFVAEHHHSEPERFPRKPEVRDGREPWHYNWWLLLSVTFSLMFWLVTVFVMLQIFTT